MDYKFLKEGILLALYLKHTPGILPTRGPWQPKEHARKSNQVFKPELNFQIYALTP